MCDNKSRTQRKDMASRTPGSGGTNQATTLEAGLIADIRRAQALERDSSRNPSGVNRISSSADDDSASFEARINFPIDVISNNNGNLEITAIDYFSVPADQQPHYISGNGGTIKSSTIQGAIIEQTLLLKNLENDSAKNPNNGNYITWSISSTITGGMGNCTFSASYNKMPLEITMAATGGQTTTGKAYLL